MKIKSKLLNKQKNIEHTFFSRKNGFSKGIYRSLNCGLGSRDLKKNIYRNINYIEKSHKIKKNHLILMKQIHSNKVKFISAKPNSRLITDGIITQNKNLALGVLTADCVPILFWEKNHKMIGCVHAGWRGAFNGIIDNFIKKIKVLTKNKFKLYAAIGPCIAQKNYEVDEKFYKNFYNKNHYNSQFFKIVNKKFYFDLRKYINKKLEVYKNIKIDNIKLDTFSNKNLFFSYRRSKKEGKNDYGRCISVIKFKKI